MTTKAPSLIGPILILDAVEDGQCHLAAIFIADKGAAPPPIFIADQRFEAETIATYAERSVYRIRFHCPADAPCIYRWAEEPFELATDLSGDLRLGYVSCNGEEHGDLDRDGAERNVMWGRLCAEHRRAPFSLLLHGGDQVYADEATDGHPLSEDWPDRIPKDPSRADLQSLRDHLRERFLERYIAVYADPEVAWIVARVPSLMQWDDHDICDGWGSLRRSRTYSPVGQTLFSAAREACLIFQHATRDGDLPGRFAEADGNHLCWRINAPGLRILAPDLRSERTRRDVMGPGGWAFLEAEAARPAGGMTVFMSSVPLLGPRLSILEALLVIIPTMQKYEDDLRDQWQSRAHRDAWRRILQLARDMATAEGGDLVAISGEIHLATRAEMALGAGRVMHQLVASGISHRAPPKGWARALGAIAALGESPLPEHPIAIRRLPGQRGRYVAQRNFLTLDRQAGAWSARWDLEQSGMTEALPIGEV